MTKNKNLLIGYRLFFALLAFSAIVTEIAVLTERGTFNAVNFFSFFTIEGNIIAIVALLMGALAAMRNRQSAGIAALRGAATVYILVVGIGFAALLSGRSEHLTAVPWDNIVLHYIMPLAVLIDWLIDPPKARLVFQKSLYWLLFPVVYVSYTLTRGVFVDWYPYPFLNPDLKGYGYVAAVTSSLLMLGVVLIWILSRLPKAKK